MSLYSRVGVRPTHMGEWGFGTAKFREDFTKDVEPELEVQGTGGAGPAERTGGYRGGDSTSGKETVRNDGVQWGSHGVVCARLCVPEPHLGELQGQNDFHDNAKTLFAFFTLILSLVYRVFQTFHDV